VSLPSSTSASAVFIWIEDVFSEKLLKRIVKAVYSSHFSGPDQELLFLLEEVATEYLTKPGSSLQDPQLAIIVDSIAKKFVTLLEDPEPTFDPMVGQKDSPPSFKKKRRRRKQQK